METSWGAMLHRPAHYKACQACTRSSAAKKRPRGRLYDGEVKAPDFFKSKLAHCRLRCCGLWINFRLESQGRSGVGVQALSTAIGRDNHAADPRGERCPFH